MATADLLIDARGPEIQHRTGITAPDMFIYLRTAGETGTVFFDAREYDVQKQNLERAGKGVAIERLEPYLEKASKRPRSGSAQEKALLEILDARGIDRVRISANMPYGWVKVLQDAGKIVVLHDYASERRRKTERELDHIIAAQRVTEGAYALVRDLLRVSTIHGEEIRHEGRTLTSEWVKTRVQTYFLEHGFSCPDGIIGASADQTARPHDMGGGPLRPHECIIVDIFPRDDATGYYADMTRTFAKGKPRAELCRIYDAVKSVQEEVLEFIDVGKRCADVYHRTVDAFTRLGFETSPERGFMHRTGHSLGLGLHEGPSLGATDTSIIEPGMVLTVEPGLYYPGVGGARVEDIVVFHEDGRKENITRYDKEFIIP